MEVIAPQTVERAWYAAFMARTPLGPEEISRRLPSIAGWTFAEGCLQRTFQFPDFVRAFSFMTAVALVAESKNHHPDWRNVYRSVEVRLNTHDASGVTELDFELAAAMNALAE